MNSVQDPPSSSSSSPSSSSSIIIIIIIMLATLCVLVVVAAAATGVEVRETAGPQLWRVAASSHHRELRSLENEGHLDIWGGSGSHAQVMVEEEAMERVERALKEAGLEHNVEVEDVLGMVEEKTAHLRRKRSVSRQMDWTSYHDFNDIEAFIATLNQTSAGFLRQEIAAYTEEGRPVIAVRVTDPTATGNKKRIWIEGGIHAREWISPAVTTFIMYQLATNPNWQPLLKLTEWYLVPVANPDGYQFSFSGDTRSRLWRKNRRSNDGRCKGVDLNRNWDLKWGVGASGNPCSETYKGPSAFSERETLGLQSLMRQIGDIDLFITFHSFGQTVLYPWGWTVKPPANVRMLKRVAKKFGDTVKQMSKGETNYQIGGSGPLYGLASGATDDWAYGELAVPFSYTIELPDQGDHGFLLPESRISDTVREAAAGVYCMASYISNYGECAARRARNPDLGFQRQSPRFRDFRG
ncbi:carboxypeptidase B-like isoform X2 [Eriocheir sinensis]|uniref:carboxypeptidase B-like isoform X2 n=1 Tax=Eriocheir sinensis TaxID=95602 RepID=UPI0021CA7738|nr:carboxypeptidase B-like isoform X2 [Eriocheir sinensis]